MALSMFRKHVLLALLYLFAPGLLCQPTAAGWPTYGGNPGGQRFSPAVQINRQNVSRLRPAWTYHTRSLTSSNHNVARSDFEATPILFRDTLYLATPFDRVIALNAADGKERWTFDPHIPDDVLAANYTSRGVAVWQGRANDRSPCSSRIFVGTLDARLIALDATNGARCGDFGAKGEIDLKRDVPTNSKAPYRFFGNTSPPTVVGDIVVVGSAVGDNQAVDVEPGYVRGFDVRSGRQLWSWDPMPWAAQQKVRTGGGNAWGVIAADAERGLVYVPTGSPAPDFYGGLRPGNNADASSLVAIEAATGRKVWSFQLVHHDIWDYDVASEPLLFEFQGKTPAVAIASKVGVLFVLNRVTGAPLYPVEERPVPKSDIPGEQASPTQPFTSLPPLSRQSFRPEEIVSRSPADAASCLATMRHLRYEGAFTPPSMKGTLQFPGSLGGVNWGSMAFDPTSGTLYANTNGSAYEIRLLAQESAAEAARSWPQRHRRWTAGAAIFLLLLAAAIRRPVPSSIAVVVAILAVGPSLLPNARRQTGVPELSSHKFLNSPDAIGEISPQSGTPYRIYRRVLQDEHGRPCTIPPWARRSRSTLTRASSPGSVR